MFTARYVLPKQFIVYCVDLETNSDCFAIQNYLTDFYNRGKVCLRAESLNMIQANVILIQMTYYKHFILLLSHWTLKLNPVVRVAQRHGLRVPKNSARRPVSRDQPTVGERKTA